MTKSVIKKLGCLALGCLFFTPQLMAQDEEKYDFTDYIVNPSFELYFDEAANDGAGEWKTLDVTDPTTPDLDGGALRFTPPGWKDTGWDPNNYKKSYGVNRGAEGNRNKTGYNSLWVQHNPMPVDFSVYQEVEGLPAGTYTLSCKMLPNSDNPVGLQRLFATAGDRTVVQYFQAGDYYAEAALTTGETNTFAGYPHNRERMRGLSVTIDIAAGETLTLGIKTTNKDKDGNVVTTNIGCFRVDDFRLIRQGDPKDMTSKIANPSFEKYEEGDQIIVNNNDPRLTNGALRNTPPGWSDEGIVVPTAEGGTLSYGINDDANNMDGSNACWVGSFPFPESFMLYQEIADLPAGTYRVSCDMACMQTNKITTQRLFANDQVQYYGKESDYDENLTEGENNTFAGYEEQSSSNGQTGLFLQPMSVEVTIAQGETLKLGIKTSNKFANGSTTEGQTGGESNAGWFKVDNFRLYLLEEAKASDATLKEIQIDGVPLDGFAANKMKYAYQLAADATKKPVITATATDEKATVGEVTYPDGLEGEATIVVTAEDGKTQAVYTIVLSKEPVVFSSDATLKEILIDGVALDGFEAAKTSYSQAFQGTVPTITATANDAKATVGEVKYPKTYPGEATIEVTAEDGSTKIYTIKLTDTTALDKLSATFYASVNDGILTVDGLDAGTVIRVYTLTGLLVADSEATTISLPSEGIYFVEAAGKTLKVIY